MMVLANLFRIESWYDIYYLMSVIGWIWAGVFFLSLLIVALRWRTKMKKCNR